MALPGDGAEKKNAATPVHSAEQTVKYVLTRSGFNFCIINVFQIDTSFSFTKH